MPFPALRRVVSTAVGRLLAASLVAAALRVPVHGQKVTGAYNVTAVATDILGISATSSPVAVTVNP